MAQAAGWKGLFWLPPSAILQPGEEFWGLHLEHLPVVLQELPAHPLQQMGAPGGVYVNLSQISEILGKEVKKELRRELIPVCPCLQGGL